MHAQNSPVLVANLFMHLLSLLLWSAVDTILKPYVTEVGHVESLLKFCHLSCVLLV